MPNLNEFINKPEIIKKKNLEAIEGLKPCSKCEKDATESFWDAESLTLEWECPDGHSNKVVVG